MRGDLIEAEHIGRYRWATPLVAGRTVLDAGCGTAYGATILAAAGALSVEGVDIAEDVVRIVQPHVPESVNLKVADVQQLPFDDGVFDVVVCFEVLEHLDDAEEAVREFARVLTKGGFVAVSSPNRTVYPTGNPHHKHEFLPEELRLLLDQHFEFVDLYRQQAWLASAVLTESDYVSEATELADARLHKVARAELGTEMYTVAVAGSAPLPLAPAEAVLTSRPGTPLTMEDALKERVTTDGQGEQGAGKDEVADTRDRMSKLEARLREATSREKNLERCRSELSERVGELEASLREATSREKNLERYGSELSERVGELETSLREASSRERKLERYGSELSERVGELEARLRDANDQMLRRDEELQRALEHQRAYADEAAQASDLREATVRLDNLVQSRDAQIRELNEVIAGMQATRVWRLGSAYWAVRDRLRLRGGR
jgi:ubiquinone/menaquinone biosynthesis C-methylase UbiE